MSHTSARRVLTISITLGLAVAACSPAAPEATPIAPVFIPTATAPASATATSAPASATEAVATPTTAAATTDQLRLVLAPEGNEARYLVREQLANISFPSDAIGTTSDITGAIVLNADGSVVSTDSKFVVDLTTLQSDSGMRDGFIQRNTLETQRFPTAEFVPTDVIGLPSPLPTSGEVTFQLVGDLTLHGVTQRTTWEVTAQVVDQALVGKASTRFTFGDFGLAVPNVARVLSIEDDIRLEYDFRLVVE